jgi:hypothetical protein
MADVTHRRPAPRHPGLFLVQLRSHVVHTTHQNRKKVIYVDVLERPDRSHPVKITHLHGPLFPASVSAQQ